MICGCKNSSIESNQTVDDSTDFSETTSIKDETPIEKFIFQVSEIESCMKISSKQFEAPKDNEAFYMEAYLSINPNNISSSNYYFIVYDGNERVVKSAVDSSKQAIDITAYKNGDDAVIYVNGVDNKHIVTINLHKKEWQIFWYDSECQEKYQEIEELFEDCTIKVVN